MRCIISFASFVLAASLALAAAGGTDYQAGYRQGRKEARELKKELGPLARPAYGFADGLGIEPGVDGKSDAWNEGYVRGVRDEMSQ